MSKLTKVLLFAAVVVTGLVFIGVGHAQLPPEYDATGAAYLRVNINPTSVPPMVNINPNNNVPSVKISEMPEIRMTPAGCENRRNYQTGVGRSVAGPMMITYLHLPDQARVTLGDSTGSHSMNLGSSGQITTAIFLGAGQRLDFDAEVMYSGCKPD